MIVYNSRPHGDGLVRNKRTTRLRLRMEKGQCIASIEQYRILVATLRRLIRAQTGNTASEVEGRKW